MSDRSTDAEFSADQIEEGITYALAEGDVQIVPPLIALLAVRDPARAKRISNAIQVALAMREAADRDLSGATPYATGDHNRWEGDPT